MRVWCCQATGHLQMWGWLLWNILIETLIITTNLSGTFQYQSETLFWTLNIKISNAVFCIVFCVLFCIILNDRNLSWEVLFIGFVGIFPIIKWCELPNSVMGTLPTGGGIQCTGCLSDNKVLQQVNSLWPSHTIWLHRMGQHWLR